MSRHDDDHHHPAPLAPLELRAKALEELLTEKGILRPGFLDAIVTAYENDIGPMNGARVVARAWVDPAYRARMVREPRVLLREMGLDLPEDVEIRVWDSSAESRYMVLPERPAGTESLDEAALAALVSRDAMIGTVRP